MRYVEGNYENGAAYTFILFITFWILYSYLVPISLFVTMEIVKFWQVRSHLCMSPQCRVPDLTLHFGRALCTSLSRHVH